MSNLYLIVGIRGDYQPLSLDVPDAIDVALLHTMDMRWGIAPPWGACDSGADLETAGQDVLRAWSHVDLRRSDADKFPDDVLASALLRTTWDTLEIFGSITLTGVDAIVPPACAGERTWLRVAGSVLRERKFSSPPRVRVHVGRKQPAHDEKWNRRAILEVLADLVDVRSGADRVASSYSEIPDMFRSSDMNPLQAEAVLPAWTIDDAAWLVEAITVSCHRARVTQDVKIAVKRVRSDP